MKNEKRMSFEPKLSIQGEHSIQDTDLTGDLGRGLPNASLEFIEQLDNQVKRGGFRIELGEIEGVLSQHPAVKESFVMERENPAGEKQLVAYLVANLQDDALQALHTKQVSLWQALHDKSYNDSPSPADPTFNIIGWDSSYTGLPLSDEEMQECVETTVEKILSLNPQHLLEIGCGTGLLMYRILPHCVDYVGTDFSKIVLHQLEESKRFMKIKGLEHTTLLTKQADDFEGFEAQAFDTVIINSVVQYFPCIDYLLTVLKGALKVVKPGGAIFIGDVRSLPLLKAYHASVQVYKAVDFVTRSKLEARIREREQQEEELAIDPVFFVALKQAFPEINRVKIQPKRGLIRDEMTRFRYDVILDIQGSEGIRDESEEKGKRPLTEAIVWEDWEQKPLALLELAQRLICRQPAYVALRHVGNGRITTEIKTLEWLATADDDETVGDLRDALVESESKRIDPEALWEICLDVPYDIDMQFSLDRADGCYDVLLRNQLDSEFASVSLSEFQFPMPPSVHQNWHEYANHPLQEQLTLQLFRELREFMKEKLPDEMMPKAFVILNAFPLTDQGKIDRGALAEGVIQSGWESLAADGVRVSDTN
jgi:ubiquinone/menaquinone biosynthesis C-methylase UbiE